MISYSKVEPSIHTLDFSDDGIEKFTMFAKEKQSEYVNNVPFPHIVIDGLFPDELLEDVVQDIKDLNHPIEKNFYGSVKKFATSDPWSMGPTARRFLLDMNSSKFCGFLEKLTEISGLVPDPYYEGGGVHEINTDGFLKVHTDFNWNKKLKLDRRLNMLIYLNKDWDEAWGGDLELWDSKMTNRCINVSPSFNKTVIFSTTDFSYHGHPDPVKCPDTISRKSLALYYYSNGRPSEEVRFQHSSATNYKERPGERFHKRKKPVTAKQVIKKVTPPILIDLFNYVSR